jgi:hypothetical protein
MSATLTTAAAARFAAMSQAMSQLSAAGESIRLALGDNHPTMAAVRRVYVECRDTHLPVLKAAAELSKPVPPTVPPQHSQGKTNPTVNVPAPVAAQQPVVDSPASALVPARTYRVNGRTVERLHDGTVVQTYTYNQDPALKFAMQQLAAQGYVPHGSAPAPKTDAVVSIPAAAPAVQPSAAQTTKSDAVASTPKPQCKGTNAKGQPCKAPPMANGLCYQHGKSATAGNVSAPVAAPKADNRAELMAYLAKLPTSELDVLVGLHREMMPAGK